MTCETKVPVDSVGIQIEVELLEDCTTAISLVNATVKEITIARPDETTFTREGLFTTDGSDGKLYFTTEAGDLSMSGTYYIQAYLELVIWQGNSTIGEFEVFNNLV